MTDRSEPRVINLIRPKPGYMTDEVKVIFVILICWGAATFGFKLLLRMLAENPQGDSWLTRLQFFNLPFSFWFTGQLLPLWFIVLCIVFNLYIDRLTERYSRMRDGDRRDSYHD